MTERNKQSNMTNPKQASKQASKQIISTSGVPNWENRTLFHGDNLKFLRSMNSESVHLIATDPPFNKGRDFHATPDSLASGASFQDRWSWADDVDQEWVDQITDDFPKVMNVIQGSRNSYGDDMGAFLCFMAVRLIEMHRVLRIDGSIYLHCDPTASHYLKELLDAIFGRRNFVNEIVWCYNVGGKGKRSWARKHDIILFFSKTKKYQFDGKAVGIPRDTGSKSFGGKIGIDENGRSYQDKIVKKTGKIYRYYLDEPKIPEDWWVGINSLQSGVKERTGYPTQKPLALYERIIKASSKEGDIVFDPFAGCATTCIAAERLGRQWVGIDIWDKVKDVVVDRLAKEGLIAPKYTRQTAVARQTLLFAKDLHFTDTHPERTDDGEEAVPFLKTKLKVDEPKGKKMSRAAMLDFLLEQNGSKCQGCDRQFDDPRYLELDHNTPRSDGGINHISNRVLLCSPCNRAKSNQYTLSGLRRLNKKNGWIVKP